MPLFNNQEDPALTSPGDALEFNRSADYDELVSQDPFAEPDEMTDELPNTDEEVPVESIESIDQLFDELTALKGRVDEFKKKQLEVNPEGDSILDDITGALDIALHHVQDSKEETPSEPTSLSAEPPSVPTEEPMPIDKPSLPTGEI